MDLTKPSELKAVLLRHGLQLSKRFGQNFLISRSHLLKVVDAADVQAGDRVFEIGPGAGTLTVELAARAERVIAVELDRALPPVLAEVLAPFPHATLFMGDALKLDLPVFLREHLGEPPYKVVANIPYNITSPILVRLLENKALFISITLMVQKEVAERLKAMPGTAAYGSLSVFAQYQAHVSVAGTVPRGAFFPPPKVDSAVIHLIPRPVPPVDVPSDAAFFRVSRAVFGQRRKTLANALMGASPGAFAKEEVASALTETGIDGTRRGETLTLAEIATLTRALPVAEVIAEPFDTGEAGG
ncbi:MAG: 16S rRNA (adenine(1518)-N(6)/adenine(1519)-N(6))-dimethyltransferase RsmA [Akkermansiaceae bacterium]|nr:16S rRNA (adenine(1518)-N(6)/adenine(1519)-N(6))-dimethyltransferase RsmA [Armatimonadota bacterium]